MWFVAVFLHFLVLNVFPFLREFVLAESLSFAVREHISKSSHIIWKALHVIFEYLNLQSSRKKNFQKIDTFLYEPLEICRRMFQIFPTKLKRAYPWTATVPLKRFLRKAIISI